MSNFISVIFCRNCSSRYVEISEWSSQGKAIISCRSCGNREEISGFTLGRSSLNQVELENARNTMAKKGNYEK